MGTYIDCLWQHKTVAGVWENTDEQVDVQQSYALFQLLGSSRGNMTDPETGKRVPPIIEKYRGAPPDTLIKDDCGGFGYDNAVTVGGKFFYDGVASYILGSEILEWMKSPPHYIDSNWIPEQIYNAWDKVSVPPDYSEMSEKELTTSKRIRAEWVAPCTNRYPHFFEEVVKLMNKYGEVRLIYGWDY